MKFNPAIAATIALLSLLTGCANGQFDHIMTASGKCLTCINNPITGKPINHDGPGVAPLGSPEANKEIKAEQARVKEIAERLPPTWKKVNGQLTLPVPLDKAYIRIKREMRFSTPQEIHAEWGEDAGRVMDDIGWAYEAVPSVIYNMRTGRAVDGSRYITNERYLLEVEMTKASENTTDMKYTFWFGRNSVSDTQAETIMKKDLERMVNATKG